MLLAFTAAPGAAQAGSIATVDAIRLRAQPSATGAPLQTLDIATPLVTEGTASGDWIRVRAGTARGWVRRDLTVAYDAANPLPALRRIATRSIGQESAPFVTRARLVNVLDAAARVSTAPTAKAELSLLRLRALQKAFDEHVADPARAGGSGPNPMREGRMRVDSSEVVYGDPQGQWFVTADAFRALRDRYRALSIAEAIAWDAATQPLPGECEDDPTCVFTVAEITAGRYLSLYPRGTHAPAALRKLTEVLGYVEASARDGPFCRRSGADGAVTPARITALATTVGRSGGANRGRVSTLLRTLAGRCR